MNSPITARLVPVISSAVQGDGIVGVTTPGGIFQVSLGDNLTAPDNPAKGAGVIGFNEATGYATGTVGKALSDALTIAANASDRALAAEAIVGVVADITIPLSAATWDDGLALITPTYLEQRATVSLSDTGTHTGRTADSPDADVEDVDNSGTYGAYAITPGAWRRDGDINATGIASNEQSIAGVATDLIVPPAGLKAAIEQVQFISNIDGLGRVSLWDDGYAIEASDPESVFYEKPAVEPSDGTAIDDLRFADETNITPASNREFPVFVNNSANWGDAAFTGITGIRLPTAQVIGDMLLVAGLGFTSGTQDAQPSKLVINLCPYDSEELTITLGTPVILMVDSTATNRLTNPCLVHNPVSERTYLIFNRDTRGGANSTVFFEVWSDDAGVTWQGPGGAFSPGATDASARTLSGVLDPLWHRAYPSPQAGIVDEDGTMYVPCWAVINTGPYVMFVLKRAVGDSEWTRIWTLTGGTNTGQNEDRVLGEQSITFLENGNILVVGRPTNDWAGRYYWVITPAGSLVTTGKFEGFFPVAIGAGVERIPSADGVSRIMAIGPRVALSTSQNDVGMHAAILYDDDFAGDSWYEGPAWRPDYREARESLLGVAFSAPDYYLDVSGNTMLCPGADGQVIALIERNGPTNAGSAAPYIAVTARILTAANAFRNAEPWENN